METYGYEVILLGVEDDRTAPADIRTHAGLGQAFTDRWVAVNHARVARPAEGFRATSAADAIVVRNPAFVPDAVAADVIANAARPRADGIAILETEHCHFHRNRIPYRRPDRRQDGPCCGSQSRRRRLRRRRATLGSSMAGRFALLPNTRSELVTVAAPPAAGGQRRRLAVDLEIQADNLARQPRIPVAGELLGPGTSLR